MRIADAVTSVLHDLEGRIDWNPVLAHRAEQVELTRLRLTDEQLQGYRKSFEKLLADYLRMRRELEKSPERMQMAGWQNEITPVFWNLRQAHRVIAPYDREEPTITIPVHVVRIGDMVMATNPFELYLDYGMRIKARSKAVQTFVVQLSNGTYGYLPTKRSVAGGAYGGIPTSNEVGPEGGQELVERTLELIDSLWEEK